LDRVGDVQPVEAQLDRVGEQVAQLLAVEPGVGQLDRLVGVAEPLPFALPLVQLGRERRADALAEQPDQVGTLLRPPAHSPNAFGNQRTASGKAMIRATITRNGTTKGTEPRNTSLTFVCATELST